MDTNKTIILIFNIVTDKGRLSASPVGDPNIKYSRAIGANDNITEYESIAGNIIRQGDEFVIKMNGNAPPSQYLFERIDGGTDKNFQLKATISF